MTHLDEDALAAMAMEAGAGDASEMSEAGDADPTGGPEASAHLAGCAQCQAELEQYRFTLQLARDSRHVGDLQAPPTSVFAAIMAELDEAVEPVPGAQVDAQGTESIVHRSEPVVAGAVVAEPDVPDNVVSLESRRSRRWLQAGLLVSVAAAAAVVGWGLGSASKNADDVVVQPAPDATVELATLDTAETLGEASVIRTNTATDLVVTSEPLDAGDGFLEVWLINVDGTRMVSVGVLDGNTATFPISDELLSQGYRIVDISQELFDDQPAHSGQSLVRGTLPA